jgi:hypothetical protein
MTITLQRCGTGQTIQLDAESAQFFSADLEKTKDKEAEYGVPPRLAPDYILTIQDGQEEQTYELYGRGTILHDKATDRTWSLDQAPDWPKQLIQNSDSHAAPPRPK